MAVIKFACSNCQKPMAVGPDLSGSQVRCPHCLEIQIAPQSAEPENPAPENPFHFGEAPADRSDPIASFADGPIDDPPATTPDVPSSIEVRPADEPLMPNDATSAPMPIHGGQAWPTGGRSRLGARHFGPVCPVHDGDGDFLLLQVFECDQRDPARSASGPARPIPAKANKGLTADAINPVAAAGPKACPLVSLRAWENQSRLDRSKSRRYPSNSGRGRPSRK